MDMPEMHKCINDTHQNRDQSLYSNVELSKPFLSPKVVKTKQKYIFKRIYSVDMSIQQIAFFHHNRSLLSLSVWSMNTKYVCWKNIFLDV